MQRAAEEVAANGAKLAGTAGFRSQSMAVQASPTWKGIVETAAAHKVSLIVLGSHRRRGLESTSSVALLRPWSHIARRPSWLSTSYPGLRRLNRGLWQ